MARGINKVIIVGNLGQDPESRSFPNGGMVTNISVATSESWTDRQQNHWFFISKKQINHLWWLLV